MKRGMIAMSVVAMMAMGLQADTMTERFEAHAKYAEYKAYLDKGDKEKPMPSSTTWRKR